MEELKKETVKQLIEAIKKTNLDDIPKIDALSRLLSTLLFDEREIQKVKRS